MKIELFNGDLASELKVPQDELSVLLHPAWHTIQGDGLQRYVIRAKDGQATGAFQVYRAKRSGLTLWTHPPFVQHCGLFWKQNASNPAKAMGERKKIHRLIAEFLQTMKGVVMLPFPSTETDMQPYLWAGFKASPSYTYRLDLRRGLEKVENDFAPELRNAVKKAEKAKVNVATTSDVKAVLKLVNKTFDRKNKDWDSAKAGQIIETFMGLGKAFAFIATINDDPIAVSFCIHDQQSAYYLLGGVDKRHDIAGAGALCVRQAIRHTASMGIPCFDMEGSMLPEVEKYFRSFGGEQVLYFTVLRAPLAVEMMMKTQYRNLF